MVVNIYSVLLNNWDEKQFKLLLHQGVRTLYRKLTVIGNLARKLNTFYALHQARRHMQCTSTFYSTKKTEAQKIFEVVMQTKVRQNSSDEVRTHNLMLGMLIYSTKICCQCIQVCYRNILWRGWKKQS